MIDKIKITLVCMISILFFNSSFSEDFNKNYSIEVSTENFIKNTEYFNSYTRGYTLCGFDINPIIVFYKEDSSLKLGYQIRKFYGDKEIKYSEPFLNLMIKTKNGHFKIGSLSEKEKYLKEYIYDYDNDKWDNFESGIEYSYNNQTLKNNLIIVWENFIEFNDDEKERFYLSDSFKIDAFNSDTMNLSFPISLLLYHEGGQIDNNQSETSTLKNYVIGSILNYKNFKIGNDLAIYDGRRSPDSGENSQIYKQGIGNYFFINPVGDKYEIGLWTADKYITPKGNKIFQSIYYNNQTPLNSKRNMLVGKYKDTKKLFEYIDFSITADTYWDIINKTFDYGYGFYFTTKERLN